MSDCVHVAPGDPQSRWAVRVPGSKSITNRALLLAGVASGQSVLLDPLVADDTQLDGRRSADARRRDRRADRRRRPAALDRRGPRWRADRTGGGVLRDGRHGGTLPGCRCWQRDAAASPWTHTRSFGAARSGPVLAALRAQGAAIDGEAFPLVIGASGLSGGEVQVDASVSSQFLSGLLMAAPFARADTRLRFDTLVSRPYLDLTLNAMRAFGVEVGG